MNLFVMRGLVPPIHVFSAQQDVDGRAKPGHDGVKRDSMDENAQKRQG